MVQPDLRDILIECCLLRLDQASHRLGHGNGTGCCPSHADSARGYGIRRLAELRLVVLLFMDTTVLSVLVVVHGSLAVGLLTMSALSELVIASWL
jgi:hypothetical protein